MSFTYDSSTPLTVLEQVRLKIGDTDSNKALLQDEEIQLFLDANGNDVTSTSVDAVKCILAQLARQTDRQAGNLSGTRSQKTQHYRELLRDLEAEVSYDLNPSIGGLSLAARNLVEADSDFKPTEFSVGMHDNESQFRDESRED